MIKSKFISGLVLTVFFSSSLFSQSFKFAAMCDSRGPNDGVNLPVLSAFVDHIMKNNSDIKFLAFPGDLVDGSRTNPEATVRELKHWKEVMAPIYNNPKMVWPKIWALTGNHELRTRFDEENFKKAFPDVFMNGPEDEKGLTYSFDFENSHFVFIATGRWYYGDPKDTTDDKADWHYVKSLDWLEKDLAATQQRQVKHIFVMGHESAFPIGGHIRDGLPNLGLNPPAMPLDSTRKWFLDQRDRFWSLLSKNKVEAYICGHEHIYGRESVDGVYQIVSGSAGAPLYYLNSKYGDNPQTKRPGQELTYDEALPYYKLLNYNYGPNGNAQASKDFVGYRAFEYLVFDVQDDKVEVKTYGAYPKEGTLNQMGTDISLIDEFTIKK
ncbi:MAG: metallophosphoesterase family protein [Bacillota bacterium]